MDIAMTKPPFAWESLEDSPSLKTIRMLLAAVPDGALLDGLGQHRGRGRNEYPAPPTTSRSMSYSLRRASSR